MIYYSSGASNLELLGTASAYRLHKVENVLYPMYVYTVSLQLDTCIYDMMGAAS